MAGMNPAAVDRALREVGGHLRTWRKLNGLTQALVADRANISAQSVRAIESGAGGVSLDSVLRVTRVLGVLDSLVDAVDPLNSDVGRLRAEERLPERVRT